MTMFSRSRNNSRVNLSSMAATTPVSPQQQQAPPPPPPPPDVWSATTAPNVTYFVRHPWEWVMRSIAVEGMTQVDNPQDLPSEKQAKASAATSIPVTPATRRRRNAAKGFRGPSTLKIEIVDQHTGQVKIAVHGNSSAFEGMEDKDELVRTLQRCRCDNLNLSPPAVLISWDVTGEECINVIGKNLPMLSENKEEKIYAVLKEPMGSQGKGIYFVASAEEIHKIIDEHRQRALKEPDLLDNLIAAKGRIPSWVLQAEVSPPLLIKDRRKFHIRTYLIVIEKLDHEDQLDLYIYNRHEVRIAGVPIPDGSTERSPSAHITNGALSNTTERVLLSDVDELTSRNIQEKTEVFVAEMFGKHLLSDMSRRISLSSQDPDANNSIRKFAVAGLDIMITEDNKVYLLEVNNNPASPPEAMVTEKFKLHLQTFLRELVDLVLDKPSPSFLHVQDILVREGLIG